MKSRLNKIIDIVFIITFFICVISLIFIWNDESKYKESLTMPQKVEITGTYSVNGKEMGQLPENYQLKLDGHNYITIVGKFNQDIPLNQQIMVRIDNLYVKFFVNGEEIYSFGDANTMPAYINSAGNVSKAFVSPGITKNDEIRVELYNVYTNRVQTVFEKFLDNIYFGYESHLMTKQIGERLTNILLAIAIIVIGIITFVFSTTLYRIQRAKPSVLCFATLSIFSGIWILIDFEILNYFSTNAIFNNSLDIISMSLTAALLLFYFATELKSKAKLILVGNGCAFLAFIVITTLTQFLGIMDYYDYVPIITIMCLIAVLLVIGAVFYEGRKCYSEEIKNLTLATIIVCISVLADVICNTLEIIPYLFWFKIGYFLFILIQFKQTIKFIRELVEENIRMNVLTEIAYTDSLTGIKNRSAYTEKVEEINGLIKKENGAFGVVIFDVNNLKAINDTIGHEVGDKLIISASKMINQVFKKNALYRIGGDEFVAILEQEELECYQELLEKFQSLNGKNSNALPQEIKIFVACGIATYNELIHKSYEDVFREADEAMYMNKMQMKRDKNSRFM